MPKLFKFRVRLFFPLQKADCNFQGNSEKLKEINIKQLFKCLKWIFFLLICTVNCNFQNNLETDKNNDTVIKQLIQIVQMDNLGGSLKIF